MNKVKIPKNWEFKYFVVDGNTTKFVYEDQLGIEHIYIDEKPEPELPTYEELQDKIDSAINYIEKTDTFQIVHSTDELAEMLREKTIKDLLDILKGD